MVNQVNGNLANGDLTPDQKLNIKIAIGMLSWFI